MKKTLLTLSTIIFSLISSYSYCQTEYIEINCKSKNVNVLFKIKPFIGMQETHSFLEKQEVNFIQNKIIFSLPNSDKYIFDINKGTVSESGKILNIKCNFNNLNLIKKTKVVYKGKYTFDAREFINNYKDYTISEGLVNPIICLENSFIFSKQIMNAIKQDKYPNQIKILLNLKKDIAKTEKKFADSDLRIAIKNAIQSRQIFLRKNLKPTSFKLYENKIEWLDADLENEIENGITFIDKVPLGSGANPRLKVRLEILHNSKDDKIFIKGTFSKNTIKSTCSMPFSKDLF